MSRVPRHRDTLQEQSQIQTQTRHGLPQRSKEAARSAHGHGSTAIPQGITGNTQSQTRAASSSDLPFELQDLVNTVGLGDIEGFVEYCVAHPSRIKKARLDCELYLGEATSAFRSGNAKRAKNCIEKLLLLKRSSSTAYTDSEAYKEFFHQLRDGEGPLWEKFVSDIGRIERSLLSPSTVPRMTSEDIGGTTAPAAKHALVTNNKRYDSASRHHPREPLNTPQPRRSFPCEPYAPYTSSPALPTTSPTYSPQQPGRFDSSSNVSGLQWQPQVTFTGSAPETDEILTHDGDQRFSKVSSILERIAVTDFKIHAVLVIDCLQNGKVSVKRFPVLAKYDTGCRENLVSEEFLNEVAVDRNLIQHVPDGELKWMGIEGFRHKPREKLILSWLTEDAEQMSRATFYIVKDPPYELQLGSKQFAKDIKVLINSSSPLLVLASKKKTKEQIAAEEAARRKNLEEQDKKAWKQAEADAKTRKEKKAQPAQRKPVRHDEV